MRETIFVIAACLFVAGCIQNQPDPGLTADSTGPSDKLPNLPDPPPFAPDDALIPIPALAGKPLLNEVRYLAGPGDAPFVELKGAGVADLSAGLSLLNENGDSYPIPTTVTPIDANGIVTIYFDGQNAVTPGVVHAARTGFLNSQSGVLTLRDSGGAQLDEVTWGNRAEAVVLRGTGVIEVPPGVSLSRRPASTNPNHNDEWYVAAPIDVTPGRPNRNSGVNMLFPLDGAIVVTGDVRFDWEHLSGATEFEVQVAASTDFIILSADQMTTDGPITIPLSPGGYYWRVQAHFADGSLADWSPVNRLSVMQSELEEFLPPQENGKGIVTQAAAARLTLSHRVPLYYQHKDTKMLLLESDFPTGTRHAWDAPHPELDKNDPADNCNCALATISMINGYYANATDAAPNLSQDRISLEIRQKMDDLGYPGPEFDLGFGRGLSDEEYTFGLGFALGAPSTLNRMPDFDIIQQAFLDIYNPAFREQFWTALNESINADKPMAISIWCGPKATFCHGIAVAGRFVMKDGTRIVRLNDPWNGGVPIELQYLRIRAYWVLPNAVSAKADEEDLRNSPKDTDGDGVMDFDERVRFNTKYVNADKDRDTDQDCSEDLAEIRASVFDDKHGWGQYQSSLKRELIPLSDGSARAGKAPELNADELLDTDGGGLPDIAEDLDQDGQVDRDAGESDPHDSSDDARKITGHFKWVLDRKEAPAFHSVQTRDFDYDLQVKDGRITGTAHAVWNRMYESTDAANPPECPNPIHIVATSNTVDTTLKIDGHFLCNPGGIGPSIVLEEREPVFTHQEIVNYIDSCRGPYASLPASPRPIFTTPPLYVDRDRFFTSSNRRVQYKGRYAFSSLPTEADSYEEWDVVMEPP